jgi:hypothetical protein
MTHSTARRNTRRLSAVVTGIVAGTIAAPIFAGIAVVHADEVDRGPGPTGALCANAGGAFLQHTPTMVSCCFQEPINDQGDHCYRYVNGQFVGTWVTPVHRVPAGLVAPPPTASESR